MNTRGLTELGYLLFLDRYSRKDGTRESLKVGDTVLVQIDGQKIIGEVSALPLATSNNGKAGIIIHPATANSEYLEFPIEAIDKPLELDPAEMWQRVAQAVAEAEQTSEKFEEWHDKFKWLLEDWKFLPGGRILAAAGTDTELTYYNCYVIPSPKDSKDEIFKTLNVMAQIMSRGGGVGMNISSLRPRYAYTKKTHGRSSGAVSWGELYSYTTGLVEQSGSRRGALMLILNDWHPDVMEFVNSKRDMKRIINANISVGLSDAFMKAVELDDDWELKFPDTLAAGDVYDEVWDGDLEKWVAAGLPVKVWKTIRARDLWDAIINSAWASAEPGLWFRDRVNQYSNSQYYSKLIACNPCSEQGLGAWNVCLLGSINLSKFVSMDSDGNWDIDWDDLETAVHYAVRFLDNVIDVTPYIYPEMEEVQKSERRIGLGTMGLAEVLIRMQLRYGSDDSIRFIDNLYRFITVSAYEESIMLAKEKGKFPKFSNQIAVSKFIQNLPGSITDAISEYGLRNVTLITQAPTGTIGSMVDTSTGIEPFYYWEYERKGRFGSHNVRVKVYDEYVQGWRSNVSSTTEPSLPDYFVTAQDLTPEEHVRVQAAIQRWVDSSISKTCNVPEDYTVEQVGELYKLMYELGCKGGTIYRNHSRSEQVLNLKPSMNAEQASNLQTDKLSASLDKPRSEAYNKPGDELEHCLEIRNRPAVIAGKTYKKLTPAGNCFITLNHDSDNKPFEAFINIGKAGSDISSDAEAIGRLVSMAFRASNGNVMSCVTEVVSQLRGIGGKSVGFGVNRVSSVADALAQVLEAEYFSTAVASKISLGELCPGCGNYTVMHIEGCSKCDNCGFSAC